MKTFKLKPYADTLNSPDWKASIYNGTAIIAARDEARARMIAMQAFGIAVEVTSAHQPTAAVPWPKFMGLVECTEITDPQYQRDEEEIIEPEDLGREWKEMIS